MNDDHGDQFPGAVPAPAGAAAGRPAGANERVVRMHAAYPRKIDSAVQADREEPASADPDPMRERRAAVRRSPARTYGCRPPGQAGTGLGPVGRFTRRSLDRFDRYTLEVFNPGPPYRR
jgi:hypothetical protein